MTIGILASGAYIPRLRLARRVIADTHSWLNSALKGQGKGERAMCNWDEDPVTMAVEAARDALTGRDRSLITGLRFASTTFPFLDRLNAGIVAAALDLPEDAESSLDITATQRAGTSALAAALAGHGETLVVAAEQRRARGRARSNWRPETAPRPWLSGMASRSTVAGERNPHRGFRRSLSHGQSEYDYQWEERWIRDAGYLRIVPPVIARCLAQAGLQPADVDYFCMPGTLPKVANAVAKAIGIADTAVQDNLHTVCGETGAAHPLVMLVAAIEKAKPGDRILVAGFGQGVDALLFEVTDRIADQPTRLGVTGNLARRREETNYAKFLAFNDTMEIERGMRAEVDKQTPLSAMWRNRDTVTGLIGGSCKVCGTLQFPKGRYCVNPNCNALDSQEPHSFADKIGRINSYTADRLTYSPSPPACYGMIQFDDGGRWMMDFTDIDADELAVGQPMRMMFRIKDIDAQRGFRRYFWKAAPATSPAGRA